MADNPDVEQPFLSHLVELRDRLLRIVIVVLGVFLVLFPFQNRVYTYLADPLMAHLPEGTSMIATEVASPFLTPMKLAFAAALFLSMPFILYQFWAFVAPGLYRHERRMVLPLVVSSSALFFLGVAFAYYVVFPLVFAFLTGTAPDGVAVMTDIGRYLDFVLTLFFAFGLAFEVPIATIILVWMGVTTPEQLSKKRPYVIVGAFIIGMFLTPPDVISQTLLAFPMWVLFELGVIFSRAFVRKTEEQDEDTDSEEDADGAEDSAEPAEEEDEPENESDFVPMTEEEMEEELARIDAEENLLDPDPEKPKVDVAADNPKLREAIQLRADGKFDEAETLLYEILVEGDDREIEVAKQMLAELHGGKP